MGVKIVGLYDDCENCYPNAVNTMAACHIGTNDSTLYRVKM